MFFPDTFLSRSRAFSKSKADSVTAPFYRLNNEAEVDSPALVVFPDRIERNIDAMIRIAGGVERLRPHVKTYKMAEIIRAQMARGIKKFKAATIAEAELTASCGAADVLLAYQPVGPKVGRLVDLVRAFPGTKFASLVDNPQTLTVIASTFVAAGLTLPLYVDLNVGMNRTGVAPGAAALSLYAQLSGTAGVSAAGFHIYDGHLHDPDVQQRRVSCTAAFAPVMALVKSAADAGLARPVLIAGGTPSFALHAQDRPNVELSPGTLLLWDRGYELECPDLPFIAAAVLLCRVVSRPQAGLLCVDLGTKAVASEMPQPRAYFPDLSDAHCVAHNEEHMVLRTPDAERLAVGDVLYAIPWHICPTVNLHSAVWVARDGNARDRWPVAARARRLSV